MGFLPQARLGSRRKSHGSQTGDRRAQSLHPAGHARKRLRVLLLWKGVVLSFQIPVSKDEVSIPYPLSLRTHFLLKTSLKYASVIFSPSSNPILGSHFRMRLALVMSGQRRFGSSCGNSSKTMAGGFSKCLRMRSANSRIVISCGLPTFVGKCSFDIISR